MPRSAADDDDSDDELPEDYFEVESIVDGRKYRGKWQFLVKWVGYSDKDNSWVFEDDFGDNCMDMVREFKMNRQRKKTATKPERSPRRNRTRRSGSPPSSNEQTDSLSDDNLPLSNRLRSRKSSMSSRDGDSDGFDDNQIISKVRKSAESSSSRKRAHKRMKRSLIRMDEIQPDTENDDITISNPVELSDTKDSEVSPEESMPLIKVEVPEFDAVDTAAIETVVLDTADTVETGFVDVAPAEVPVADIPTVDITGALDTENISAANTSDLGVVDVDPVTYEFESKEPDVVVEQLPSAEFSMTDETVTERIKPVEPKLQEPVYKQPEEVKADPNSDLLARSVFSRKLAPEESFPKSVSEICTMMKSLDERGRIELIDHLTFRVGYAEMFVLISTQRPFLRIFEEWLLEAYQKGTPMSVAFIRSALTLMSVFPGSKIANYKRLIKVIREWFVVDSVCTNLADRVLKQWQYHKEISQGRSSGSQSTSPTGLGDACAGNGKPAAAFESVPVPVREPPGPVPVAPIPHAAAPAVDVNAFAADRAPLKVDIPSVPDHNVAPVPVDEVPNTNDMDGRSTSLSATIAESSLNQVHVEQDDSITYMPAGIDDDIEYPGTDTPPWNTVSIS